MVVITTHINADFDSLAAMVAAKRLYPDGNLVFPGSMEAILKKYIEGNIKDLPPILSLKGLDILSIDTLVCVDVSSTERLGFFSSIFQRIPPPIVHIFDHHPVDLKNISGSLEVIEESGSATSVIINYIYKRGIKLTPEEANLMLIGIYEDTGHLTYPTTRPSDFDAVKTLLSWGGDLSVIPSILKREMNKEQMLILSDMIKSLKEHTVGGVTVHIASLVRTNYIPDLSILVHQLIDVEGIETLFLFALLEGRIFIIARSRSPFVDVGHILESFGGGGHPSAASANIKDMTLAEAISYLLSQVQKKGMAGLKARDISNPLYHHVQDTSTINEAFGIMNKARINSLPVYHTDMVIGVVTRQEIDGALYHKMQNDPVSDLIKSPPPIVSPDLPADEVRKLILEKNYRLIFVGKDNGKIDGIITRMSLFKALYGYQESRRTRLASGGLSRDEVQRILKENLGEETFTLIQNIGEMADAMKSKTYIVGGSVRDLILGIMSSDIDIVVEGDCISLVNSLVNKFGGKIKIHQAFQTAVWILDNGKKIDFSMARAEYYESPAALPVVEHAALAQDLYRRDFTINTLAILLNSTGAGTLVDYFGGLKDIKSGKIRVLHGLSFVEDPTRAFRAIRFAVRFGFTITEETEGLIRNARKKGVFELLSHRRLLTEIQHIFDLPQPIDAIRMMNSFELITSIEPSMKLSKKVESALRKLQTVIAFFEVQFPREKLRRALLFLMPILEPIKPLEVDSFINSFPFYKTDKEILSTYKESSWRTIRAISTYGIKAGKIHQILSPLSTEIVLFVLSKIEEEEIRSLVVDYLTRTRMVRLKVMGNDLIKAGYTPGPLFTKALSATEEAKIDGYLKSKREEVEYAISFLRNSAS